MTPQVRLRDTTAADVEIFHRHRQEAEAARRANIPAPDHGTYVDYWAEHILGDESADVQTVTADGQVVGNVLAWWRGDRRYLGGWFTEACWGRGVGTRALELFLARERTRPLHADTDLGNLAAQRLMERCGFERTGTDGESAAYVLR